MKILVLNCGSSSIKYQLIQMPGGDILAKGLVQKIGEEVGKIEQSWNGQATSEEIPIPDHAAGLHRVIDLLTQGDSPPLAQKDEIEAVGHRVVHGGERFTAPSLIDDDVMAAIEENVELAPLHNPPNLLGIRVAQEVFPSISQVAVFDTAFHQTMPRAAYMYALPTDLYRHHRVRRYGFHGTSHRYVALRAATMLGRPIDEINLITCHLGNGCSVAAIRHGKSVETSMGLTPLEGLVMGTRSGDVDPGLVFHFLRHLKMDVDTLDAILNKKSGLLGLSGVSNDVRELLEMRQDGHEGATLALDVFAHRLKKYIGAYWAILGRLDALVFTAGIGENAPTLRALVTSGLEGLGLSVDEAANQTAVGAEVNISAPESKTQVLVIPTNEELMIARDTYDITRPA